MSDDIDILMYMILALQIEIALLFILIKFKD